MRARTSIFAAISASAVAIAPAARAQPAAHGPVAGRVIDAHGAPIAGAQISIDGVAATASTDRAGRFALADAPLGVALTATTTDDRHAPALAVTASAIGDVVLADLDDPAAAADDGAASADSTPATAASSSDTSGETITVTGEPPPVAPGAASLARDDLEHLPGTGDDLGQTLSILPGVASFPLPLGGAGVVIRGSSPQDSQILVDDFPVPMLYHDLGFRSIVPEEAIASLDYVPGGFDVAYGHATSGLVSLTTRGGDDQGTHATLESSTGDVGMVARGPLGDDGRYLIALRRSVIDLIVPLILPANLDVSIAQFPRYYDGQLRVDYDLSPRWQLRATSIGSDDAFDLYAGRDQDPINRVASRSRFLRATLSARYHDGPWSATLAVSGIAQEEDDLAGAVQHIDVTAPAVTERAEVTRELPELEGLRRVVWRLGGEEVHTRYGIDVAAPQEVREGEQPGAADPGDTSLSFRGHITTDDLAAWTSLAADLDPRLRLTVGARVDALARSGDVAIQPRTDLAIALPHALTARLSAGGYARPPEYQSELLTSSLRAERATQLIAGLEYEDGRGLRVQGSLYDTERRDLITRDATGALGNQGTGRTLGAELLATYRHGPWFAWLAYSYSHSTRIDAPGDPSRLFDYDQPHNLNALASYRFRTWTFGARFRLSSGLPYTPVVASIYDSDKDVYDPIYGPTNSARAELHHELDLRIEKTSRWGPIKVTRFLDVQNVYLNQAAATYLYSYDYSKRLAFRWLPIFPMVGLRAEL